MAKDNESSVSRWKQAVEEETIRSEEKKRQKRMTVLYIIIAVILVVFVGAMSFALGGRSRGRAATESPPEAAAAAQSEVPEPPASAAELEPLPEQPEEIRKLLSNPQNPVVRISTSKGDMLVELFEDKVPNIVANMIELAEDNFYKGMSFHRVIPDFMAQGGCPNSKKGESGTPGTGDPGYTFADEFHDDLSHSERGILSMANSGPDTNGSQFFICFRATPHLDGKHSVFGKVVAGLDVLDRLEEVGTRSGETKEKVHFDIQVVMKQDHPYSVEKL